MTIPPSWRDLPRWQAIVAQLVNPILQGYPFKLLDSDPADVTEGFSYYNSTTKKVRTFDGTMWHDHW